MEVVLVNAPAVHIALVMRFVVQRFDATEIDLITSPFPGDVKDRHLEDWLRNRLLDLVGQEVRQIATTTEELSTVERGDLLSFQLSLVEFEPWYYLPQRLETRVRMAGIPLAHT